MNTMTISISDKQLEQISQLLETRGGKTMEQIVDQALAHGLNNMAYRTERNKRVYQNIKQQEAELNAMREELRRLQAR